MKIWIDLTNSPHVNFFAGMIRDLKKDHEMLITCRPLANTIELLELEGFTYDVVGGHYGKNKLKKIFGYLVRVLKLYWFLKNRDLDVAISHSSFYSPIVARLLGVRNIYLNDNEYAEGNRISFLFADRIMVPEYLEISKVRSQCAKPHKILSYPGVKEGIYLWSYRPKNTQNAVGTAERNDNRRIYVRPEPWTAQYYKGERNFIDDLLVDLKDTFKIVVLPRSEAQENYYRQKKFTNITVLKGSLSLADIMENCDLFIGAGGTMTREAAVLGIPTISIYQDELLDVDKYLISNGIMVHKKNLDVAFVTDFMEEIERKTPDKILLTKGRDAYELIKAELLGVKYQQGVDN